MNWPVLVRAGVLGLRLPPDVFWSMTPAELALLLDTEVGPGPMDRAGLAELERRFPDNARKDKE